MWPSFSCVWVTLAFSQGPSSDNTSLYIHYTRLRWTARLRAGRRTWSHDTSTLRDARLQYPKYILRPLRLEMLVKGSHKGAPVLFTVTELGLLNSGSSLPVQQNRPNLWLILTAVQDIQRAKNKNTCFNRGSNSRPLPCEDNVITTTPLKHVLRVVV